MTIWWFKMRWLILLVFMSFMTSTAAYAIPEVTISKLTGALSSGKPTMLIFASDTCSHCVNMHSVWRGLNTRYGNHVNLIYSNYAEDYEFAGESGVTSVPTHIFFNYKGEEVHRFTGEADDAYFDGLFRQMGVQIR